MESKYNIFIVDDDPFNLLLISRKLKKTLNCSTRLYKSALACIHDSGKEKPDLILTDYMLTDKPGHKLNGDYVLERLKNKYENVPVIMYSSVMNADLTLSMMQKGAVDFVLRDENFLEKITKRVNLQLIKLKQKMSRRMTQIAIAISVVVLGLAALCLEGEQKALMIPFSVVWIILLALILFFKNPEDTDFYGDLRR
jgi:CheY-like chemotaxis protein